MKRLIILLFIAASQIAFAAEPRGTIEGNLGYPSEYIPAMKVCAQHVESKHIICKKLTSINYKTAKYSLKLPAGNYYIFAQLLHREGDITTKHRAYYSEFVTCGAKVGCPSHKHIAITVQANETLNNIDPTDW